MKHLNSAEEKERIPTYCAGHGKRNFPEREGIFPFHSNGFFCRHYATMAAQAGRAERIAGTPFL
jgi:hypothetical protein